MSSEVLSALTTDMLAAIEHELQRSLQQFDSENLPEFVHMITYHLGLDSDRQARGKRLRPLLTLLSCEGAGGRWQDALPFACAIELIHNFSLVHDDIEDRSEFRHGRPTIWRHWGDAQAINIGDAIYTLAHVATYRSLESNLNPEVILQIRKILDLACLKLTQGQFLDLDFETQQTVSQDAYFKMIEGKTSALLSSAPWIGAVIAQSPEVKTDAYRRYGYHLGTAFQILDDILGVWGDPNLTGKPAGDDLRDQKKSLPIIFGLENSPTFTQLWRTGETDQTTVAAMIAALDDANAGNFTHDLAKEHTQHAIESLKEADPQGAAGVALMRLTLRLLHRNR
jgi:geranylgeranyl diphosphate synthase type I